MNNDLHRTYLAVQIETTRGVITIDCLADSDEKPQYHYQPSRRLGLRYNGPCHTVKQIKAALMRSWIDPTNPNVEAIRTAVQAVRELAKKYTRIEVPKCLYCGGNCPLEKDDSPNVCSDYAVDIDRLYEPRS